MQHAANAQPGLQARGPRRSGSHSDLPPYACLLRVSVPRRRTIIRRERASTSRKRLWQKSTNKSKTLPIYILNGPNLNLLGTREPEIYGRTTLAQIEKLCAERAQEPWPMPSSSCKATRKASWWSWSRKRARAASAVIINAAGYTHTSVALLDALKMLEDAGDRGASLQSAARARISSPFLCFARRATGTITGLRPQGYLLAVDAVAAIFWGQRNEQG